nr:ferrous iron transporter B [uncultured Anaerostipes sp.]
MKEQKVIVLAGNPNVGKSTVFNRLTGGKQHTGNWTGKTVEISEGICETEHCVLHIADLPGTYSLDSHSPEEEIAGKYLMEEEFDAAVVICDGTCLERNLNLVFQIMELTSSVMLVVNLMDEADKKGICIDLAKLEKLLGVPVIGISAYSRDSIKELRKFLERAGEQKTPRIPASNVRERMKQAERICSQTVFQQKQGDSRDRYLDRLFTGKKTGLLIMFLMLALILWITIAGANQFSDVLSAAGFWLEGKFRWFLQLVNAPDWFQGIMVDGVYRVVSSVISVMLPPMLIFFPLFSLLEDFGYLPRAAYVLDCPLERCRACGKQALTMCMGLGCNAVGITGCRIIDSPRERMIAILTNVFMPCNGRFPTILMIVTIFFTGGAVGENSLSAAFCLSGVIGFALCVTLLISRILSSTLLKGEPSFFLLELPPYRKPQIGRVILESVCDRIFFVLARAVMAAAPAGALLWILANTKTGEISLLSRCADFFDPLGKIMGLDGVMFMAFLLGFPANEIVMPIAVMAYQSQGILGNAAGAEQMQHILTANGWDMGTAAAFLIFSIAHWPCAASMAAVRRETGSRRWTLLAFFLPTFAGMILCILFNFLLETI